MASSNIVLVGFMGTGKSAVGRRVARLLGREFVDLDELIVAQAGCTIPDIFELEGEAGFRARERAAVQAVAAKSEHGLVVATGGGVVLNPDNVADLEKSGKVICLTATPETIHKRIGQDLNRPLLQGGEAIKRIRSLLEKRAPVYARIQLQVPTDGRSLEEVVAAVIKAVDAE
jgi:shikimate kinase